MNKKILIGASIILVLAIAYWLISPFWRDVALNEDLPTTNSAPVNQEPVSELTAEEKAELEKQTEEMKDKKIAEDQTMPASEPAVIARAEMIAQAHEVEGSALFVKSGDETFLRFENLKTINGPDLRIYLSSDLNATDIVDLGVIRATEGNVNYTIPPGTDLKKYKYAMIWCRAFSVLFSYAELK